MIQLGLFDEPLQTIGQFFAETRFFGWHNDLKFFVKDGSVMRVDVPARVFPGLFYFAFKKRKAQFST